MPCRGAACVQYTDVPDAGADRRTDHLTNERTDHNPDYGANRCANTGAHRLQNVRLDAACVLRLHGTMWHWRSDARALR